MRRRLAPGSGLLGTVGLLLWGVVLGIGVAAYDHIARCLELLAAPGVPIEVPYEATGGRHSVRAEGVEVDVRNQRLRLREVALRRPGRPTVASAARVDVRWGGPALQLALHDVAATVERRPDGRFPIGDVLPKGKPGDKPPLLEAAVDTARVRWLDRAGGPPVEVRLTLQGVRLSQGSDDLFVRGRVGLGGSATADAAWHSTPSGSIWTWLGAPAFEAAPLLPALAKLVPASPAFTLARLRAGSVVAQGEAEFSRRAGGRPSLRFDVALRGTGVAYPGWARGARASARARGTLDAASLEAMAEEPGRSFEFRGLVGLEPSLRAQGALGVRLASASRVWPGLRAVLPRRFDARQAWFDGDVRLTEEGAALAGRAGASYVRAEGETLRNVRSRLGWDGRRLVLAQASGAWNGSRISGSASFEPRTGRVSGFAGLRSFDLGVLGGRFGAEGLRGHGRAAIHVDGTLSRPKFLVDASADGSFRLPDGSRLPFQGLRARVRSEGGPLLLEHAAASLAGGRVALSGSLPDGRRTGRLLAVATDIDLSRLRSDAEGALSAQARVGGTFKEWTASGVAELLDGKVGGIPVLAASSRFEADPGKVLLAGAKAIVLDGTAEFGGAFDLDDGSIQGEASLNGVPLSTLTDGRLYGLANAAGTFGGTLERPTGSAIVAVERLYGSGLRARGLQARLTLADGRLAMPELSGSLGGGSLNGSGEYGLSEQSGTLRIAVEGAELEQLVGWSEGLEATGQVGGSATLRFGTDGLTGANAEAKIREFVVNGTLVGSGSAVASYVGGRVSGTAQAGSLERYVSLEDVTYDIDRSIVDAQIDAYNVPLPELVTATSRWSRTLADGVQALFRQSDGYATVSGRVSGPLDDLALQGGTLAVSDLSIRGTPFGSLSARMERSGGAWQDVRLEWKDGDAGLLASGDYSPEGRLEGLVEASLIDIGKFRSVFPQIPDVRGSIDSWTAQVGGTAERPTVVATMLASMEAVVDASGGRVELPCRAILEEIVMDRRGARVRGQANVRGFAGGLTLHLPWSSFDPENLDREPVEGRIEFSERGLDELAELLPFLDTAKSQGTAAASLVIGGYADSLALSGTARVAAGRLAAKDSSVSLTDVALEVRVEPRTIVATGSAKGEEGGTVRLDASARLERPLWIGDALEATLESAALSGSVVAEGFALRHRLPSAKADSRALLDGEIQLGGTAGAARLGGYAKATELEAWLPESSEAPAATGLPDYVTFDEFGILVASGSRIRSSALDVHLGGTGTLHGSLADARLTLPLVIERGTLRLPTAQVRLEPGGVVDVALAPGPSGTTLRSTVDIEGRTQVTARRFSGQFELFDVVLTIRGDVLAPDRLTLLARSEPPELNQEEILSLLGRTDLIRAIASATIGGSFDSGLLRETLYGFALPSLTENFLASVAQQLRVDFVRVDYNPFDLFSVVIGKTLGEGLLLQASRQLQPVRFERQKYDLRLVYRVPFGDRFVRRLRLGIGTNESVPWRVSLDWSTRF